MSLQYLEPGQSGSTFRTTFNSLVDAVGTVSLTNKKLAILGDSQDVSTWESTATSVLLLGSVINMATAGARHNDNEAGTTEINMLTYGSVTADNTLSNQVRALIRDSFALGQQITWTHPVTGTVTTIDTGKGVGLGNTAPDLIYIKFGQNGSGGVLSDSDFNTVIAQGYGSLDRLNQFSSMRWAIETLSIVFPTVPIFIATPIQSTSTFATMKARADQDIRMAKFMNCPVINIFEECGIVAKFEKNPTGRYTYDGIHPGNGVNSVYDGRVLMGRFIAQRIKMYYISRV